NRQATVRGADAPSSPSTEVSASLVAHVPVLACRLVVPNRLPVCSNSLLVVPQRLPPFAGLGPAGALCGADRAGGRGPGGAAASSLPTGVRHPTRPRIHH